MLIFSRYFSLFQSFFLIPGSIFKKNFFLAEVYIVNLQNHKEKPHTCHYGYHQKEYKLIILQ